MIAYMRFFFKIEQVLNDSNGESNEFYDVDDLDDMDKQNKNEDHEMGDAENGGKDGYAETDNMSKGYVRTEKGSSSGSAPASENTIFHVNTAFVVHMLDEIHKSSVVECDKVVDAGRTVQDGEVNGELLSAKEHRNWVSPGNGNSERDVVVDKDFQQAKGKDILGMEVVNGLLANCEVEQAVILSDTAMVEGCVLKLVPDVEQYKAVTENRQECVESVTEKDVAFSGSVKGMNRELLSAKEQSSEIDAAADNEFLKAQENVIPGMEVGNGIPANCEVEQCVNLSDIAVEGDSGEHLVPDDEQCKIVTAISQEGVAFSGTVNGGCLEILMPDYEQSQAGNECLLAGSQLGSDYEQCQDGNECLLACRQLRGEVLGSGPDKLDDCSVVRTSATGRESFLTDELLDSDMMQVTPKTIKSMSSEQYGWDVSAEGGDAISAKVLRVSSEHFVEELGFAGSGEKGGRLLPIDVHRQDDKESMPVLNQGVLEQRHKDREDLGHADHIGNKLKELPRRMLQSLCKKNGIRANLSNLEMVTSLQLLDDIIGWEHIELSKSAGQCMSQGRSSTQIAAMGDTNMMVKAMNLVDKKNSLLTGYLQRNILDAVLGAITA